MAKRWRDEITLPALSEALGFPYLTLYRWTRSGLISAKVRDAGGKDFLALDYGAAVELAALVRLRNAGVPLQRIRKAVKTLRSREIGGARWLALCPFGKDVLIRPGAGELERVADRQRFLHLLDVGAIRAEVREIMERRREATA